MLAILLDDGRVMRQLPKLKEVFQSEMIWLCDQSTFVLDKIAGVAGLSGAELRDITIRAAHISVAHFYDNVITVAEREPWCLAAGDPATKLRHLAQQPEPVEMTTYKIWCLVTTGGITRDLIEAMELVADLSWVTKVAESQHARLANIKKFHPEYTLSTILSRTTVCQLNLLMPKPSKDEAVLARLEKQLAKLLTRNPRKSHGKAIFIKELFDLARENASAAKGKRVANLRHIIIKKAGQTMEFITNHCPS